MLQVVKSKKDKLVNLQPVYKELRKITTIYHNEDDGRINVNINGQIYPIYKMKLDDILTTIDQLNQVEDSRKTYVLSNEFIEVLCDRVEENLKPVSL